MTAALPIETIQGIKFLVWLLISCISLLGTVGTYLVIRFIKKNDQDHIEVQEGLKLNSEKVEKVSEHMRETATQIQGTANKIQSNQLKYQIGLELTESNKTIFE